MPNLLTPAQVAARMGRPVRTIRLWLKQGRFPGAVEPCPEWQIPEEAIEKFDRPDPRGPKKKAPAS